MRCPECASRKAWRDGFRYTKQGKIQRWLCRSCGYRFSKSKVKLNVFGQLVEVPNSKNNLSHSRILRRNFTVEKSPNYFPFMRSKETLTHFASKVTKSETLNILRFKNSNAEYCDRKQSGAKNLVKVETRLKRAAGATKINITTIKGKIVEFAWQLKKDGYANSTIKTYTTIIYGLAKQNANVLNPEDVKEFLANQNLNSTYKRNIINAYTTFLRKIGLNWEPPACNVTRKLPFIPTEKEIDDLIASCGKKMATFLQLLKETGMRCGEAISLEWTDIDFKRKTITLNKPEKKGTPRIFNVSTKLIGMLNGLPGTNERVFPSSANSKRAVFHKSKKKAAKNLQNPRLLRIKFHTFRHWKATMLYHQTKDILYVKEILGHRRIDTTLLYVQLEKALFKEITDEFTVRVAKITEEIQQLLEVGFE